MTNGKNIIRKEMLVFRYNGNTNGLALHQKVTEWCHHTLNPAIGQLLSMYEQTNEVIQIDSIDLSIDIENSADWEIGLNEKIEQQFDKILQEKISRRSNANGTKASLVNFQEMFRYYLRHGLLPWQSVITNKSGFESALREWLSNSSSEDLKLLLVSIRGENENVVLRLTNLLNDHDFEKFVADAIDGSIANIELLMNDAILISHNIQNEKSNLLFSLRKKIIEGLVLQPSEDSISHALKEWLRVLSKTVGGQLEKIVAGKISSPLVKSIITKMEKEDLDNKSTASKTAFSGPTAENAIKDVKDSGKELMKDLSEGIFISNAGAVIIAPFLHTLFSKTGLLIENKFSNESAALSLLHYCITGNTHPAEFELLLPKILCGENPSKDVFIPSVLDIKMLKEADEMLVSAIEHWSILKNTSVNGLRDSFLQRNGKLTFNNDTWLLQVEQRPYDMLLQHLPWNISMIKLPWMQYLLKTEWIY